MINTPPFTFCYRMTRFIWLKAPFFTFCRWTSTGEGRGHNIPVLHNALKLAIQKLELVTIPGFRTPFDISGVCNCFLRWYNTMQISRSNKTICTMKHGLIVSMPCHWYLVTVILQKMTHFKVRHSFRPPFILAEVHKMRTKIRSSVVLVELLQVVLQIMLLKML